jgi:hypothetical protein
MIDAELRIANAKAVVEYWLEQEGFGIKNQALREFATSFLSALDGEPTGVPDRELGHRVRGHMRAANGTGPQAKG